MDKQSSTKFSANEKEIQRLLNENRDWKESLNYIAEEINFLDLFLKADIFQEYALNLFEKLHDFRKKIVEFKIEIQQLTREISNHRHDIEGMRECEDIGCEIFYHEEHLKLEQRLKEFKNRFKDSKLDIFTHTAGYLKKRETEKTQQIKNQGNEK